MKARMTWHDSLRSDMVLVFGLTPESKLGRKEKNNENNSYTILWF